MHFGPAAAHSLCCTSYNRMLFPTFQSSLSASPPKPPRRAHLPPFFFCPFAHLNPPHPFPPSSVPPSLESHSLRFSLLRLVTPPLLNLLACFFPFFFSVKLLFACVTCDLHYPLRFFACFYFSPCFFFDRSRVHFVLHDDVHSSTTTSTQLVVVSGGRGRIQK